MGGNRMIIEANCKGFETGFLTSGSRLAFAELKQIFGITPILHYYDSEYHI